MMINQQQKPSENTKSANISLENQLSLLTMFTLYNRNIQIYVFNSITDLMVNVLNNNKKKNKRKTKKKQKSKDEMCSVQ